MTRRLRILLTGLAATSALLAGTAQAAPVQLANGGAFSVNWAIQPLGGGSTLLSINASADFLVSSLSANQAVLDINVINLADAGLLTWAPGYNAGITSIGFAVDPNATGVGFQQLSGGTGAFDVVAFGSIPSLSHVEICAWTANSCNGGAQGQLLADGQSDNFRLTLNRVASELPWNLDWFGIKVQTSYGSVEDYGTVGASRNGQPARVPEPATLALLSLGLFGLALARRRVPIR